MVPSHHFVWIEEGPAIPDDHLHAGLFGQLDHLVIPIPGIGVCLLSEHEMGDVPCFPELGENRLGCVSHDPQFLFGVELAV